MGRREREGLKWARPPVRHSGEPCRIDIGCSCRASCCAPCLVPPAKDTSPAAPLPRPSAPLCPQLLHRGATAPPSSQGCLRRPSARGIPAGLGRPRAPQSVCSVTRMHPARHQRTAAPGARHRHLQQRGAQGLPLRPLAASRRAAARGAWAGGLRLSWAGVGQLSRTGRSPCPAAGGGALQAGVASRRGAGRVREGQTPASRAARTGQGGGRGASRASRQQAARRLPSRAGPGPSVQAESAGLNHTNQPAGQHPPRPPPPRARGRRLPRRRARRHRRRARPPRRRPRGRPGRP